MGINLINNRLKLNRGHVYVIKCTKHHDDWYFVEIDDNLNKAVWTAHTDQSQLFTEKLSAIDFKQIYLSERECTVLLIE
jgi:Iap family predicted aminopeptidase